MEKEYTIKLWTMAIALYEESDKVGIPLHKQDIVTRDAWRNAARKELNRSALSELSAQVAP
jgi:hypothetical protein